MLKPLLACVALAALPVAAVSQPPANPAEWRVAGGAGGCIAHRSFAQGTVVSVMAGPGQESLLFIIQNRGWSSLEDGTRHDIAVQLDGSNSFEFDAVAKTELDSDGPGLIFTVQPGDNEGARFLAAFAGASGMNVGQDGRALASLPLRGGSTAMTGLAQCMARMWNGGAAPTGEQAEPVVPISSEKSVKI